MTDLKMPDGVIYDWDNTLADGWKSIAQAMNAARAGFGKSEEERRAWSVAEAKKYCTRALRESFPDWFGADWEKAKEVFYDVVHKTHLSCLQMTKGADALLRWFDQAGVPQFIVSNKRGDILRKEVEQLGWKKLFKATIGAMDAEIDKPARPPVDKALLGTGLTPETADIWMVGDKEIDVICAKNAHCRPVLVNDMAEAERIGLDLAFSDCEALLHGLICCTATNL